LASINSKTLEYEIELSDFYKGYLASDFFNEKTNNTGDEIYLEEVERNAIDMQLKIKLDEEFKKVIEENRNKSLSNLDKIKKEIPSLGEFINNEAIKETNVIITQDKLLETAIHNKGKAETDFWRNDKESKDYDKIINSSLCIYVKHREKVLKEFFRLIELYDDEGQIKKENEEDIHNLIMRRGLSLENSENNNHIQNLWLIDDKYGYFSESSKGFSSKRGEKKSDIYLWTDDPQKPSEIIIIELKSTIKAHNPGEMVIQVKEYAQDFYKEPRKILNWDVNTKNCLYTGYIIGSKKDILKEHSSNSAPDFKKIPFLNNSYYADTNFSTGNSVEKIDIRIEMFAYEDLYELASKRNKVFFDLLKKENP